MRSIEDKGLCYNLGPATPEISSGSNAISFEFHKGNGASRTPNHHRTALGKPTPSKWDDAQKWLVGLSRGGGEKDHSKTKPRNSNADDRRLIGSASQREREYISDGEEGNGFRGELENQLEVETKKVDCEESSMWRINKKAENSNAVIRSVCVRDMGTEMTPIGSQEPSRAATPIRATTPVARSPISSGSSTPVRCQNGMMQGNEGYQTGPPVAIESRREECNAGKVHEKSSTSNNGSDKPGKTNQLETRATAWDEAERAKYMARYKREEVKIQAWENHQKRKAEMEMKKMEVKAERMKARAQEKCANKVAATRRMAEEKRANAEAKLNEKAVKTSERADYIRRTGHLPSSFSFKLPSLCW